MIYLNVQLHNCEVFVILHVFIRIKTHRSFVHAVDVINASLVIHLSTVILCKVEKK